MNNLNVDLINKKIGVLGYGVNNQKLIDWLIDHGARDITICDKSESVKDQLSEKVKQNNVKIVSGQNYLDGIDGFELILRTPGIPYLNHKIQQAKKAGVEISSQTKLFFKLCPGKIIGITGTKGKGTTASLIYNMLKHDFDENDRDNKVFLAGNMGIDPFQFLDEIGKNDWVVTELSSFQLQDMDISPHIAVVLNITSDHLDYHKSNQEYVEAKSNIVRFQRKDDYTIINQDYLTSFEFAALSQTDNDYYFSVKNSVDLGTYLRNRDQKIIFNGKEKTDEIIGISDIKLLGKHNLENICAGVTVAKIVGVNNESIRTILSSFSGNEHRLEFVADIDGIKYYNDSASTNPDTTRAAILSFDKPIILIAGGSDKGLDYGQLKDVLVKKRIKKLILMGATAEKIKSVISDDDIDIVDVDDMRQAVDEAAKDAASSDVVLLSPASASFGIFANYQDRGKQFKEEVLNKTTNQ